MTLPKSSIRPVKASTVDSKEIKRATYCEEKSVRKSSRGAFRTSATSIGTSMGTYMFPGEKRASKLSLLLADDFATSTIPIIVGPAAEHSMLGKTVFSW